MVTGDDRLGGWIQTYTGRVFHPFDPDPESIVIEDIAHALAMKCRYNGHCLKFFSVAQHCTIGAEILVSSSQESALRFLLHDGGEGYLPDIPTPIKDDFQAINYHVETYSVHSEFESFRAVENRIMRAIGKRFGLSYPITTYEVKKMDLILLATEKRDLMFSPEQRPWTIELPEPLSDRIRPCGPESAERKFMDMFDSIISL